VYKTILKIFSILLIFYGNHLFADGLASELIEEEAYTPSLTGMMAEVNDPTSVYNNPGAMGFLNTWKNFQISMSAEAISQIRHSPTLQIDLRDKKFLSLYVLGVHFGVTSTWEGETALIAKRFGNFSIGFQLRDNSSDIGVLLVINDKFRVALASDILYDPMEIHGRGGFIYQPSDWYYLGVDVFPRLKKIKIVNTFLEQRFYFDNISIGLEIDSKNENLNWESFIQGVFALKYLQLSVNGHFGVSEDPELMVERSNYYGFTLICSLNFGF
jgi:hypothetical protein